MRDATVNRNRAISLLQIVLVAAVHYGAARLGLALSGAEGNVSLFWPAAGLDLALLLLLGIRVWPGIALGALLASLGNTHFLSYAAGGVLAATLPPIGATYLLRHVFDFQNELARIRDVLAFLGLGVLAQGLASALIGTPPLCLTAELHISSCLSLTAVWWLGNSMGVLLAAPVLLVWGTGAKISWPGRRMLEVVTLLILVAGTSYFVFSGSPGRPEFAYLLLPLLLWPVLRFGLQEATTISLAAAGAGLTSAILGNGPFDRSTIGSTFFLLWSYVGLIASGALLLTAAVRQRQTAQATHIDFLTQVHVLGDGEDTASTLARLRTILSVRLLTTTLMILVISPLLVFFYESAKQIFSFFLPGWAGFTATILFASSVTALAGYLFFRRQNRLYEQLLQEILARRRVEETRQELTVYAQELQETTEALELEIAERRRTESALRDSEERWRSYFAEADDLIFTLDAEGQITSANRTAAELFGYEPEQVAGIDPLTFVRPEEQERVRHALARIAAGEEIPQLEVRAITKDGKTVYLEIRGRALYQDNLLAETFHIARDITKRKTAELALRESEEQNRALLRAIPDTMFLQNREGVFLEYHASDKQLFGSPGELLGKTMEDVLPPALAAQFRTAFTRITRAGKNERIEYTFPVEGEAHAFEARIVRSGEDKLLTIIRDISERKRAEERLLREKLFSETLLNTLPGIFAIFDRHGALLRWNENVCQVTGYADEELSEMKMMDFFPAAAKDRFQRQLEHVLRHGRGSMEATLLNRSGQRVPYFFTGRLLLLDGEPTIIGIGLNIADRKQAEQALRESEQRYRLIFAHSPLGILHFDNEGIIIDCNDKFVEIIGSSHAALTGFDMLSLLQDEELKAAVVAALAGEVGYYEGEYTSVTAGKTTPVRALFSQIVDEANIGLGGIGIVEDITERQRAEAALRRKQKLESLGVLAGGIAHDFNNLLVAMLGQGSLALARLSVENPARPHVQKVLQAAEHASDLTRQLLAYSGRGQFEIRPLQINTLILENLHLFQIAIPKNVELHSELTEPLPLIEADAGQIQQVVMNLILNAAEAVGTGPGMVSVTTATDIIDNDDERLWQPAARPVSGGRYVTLKVRDNGSGMDRETQARIFDPFFTTKFTGRGLGLAAVLGIVRSHKGGLQVESTLGAGTTFTIYLPASDAVPVEAAPHELTLAEEMDGEGYILVVDDEEPVREAIGDIFEMEGWPVLSAANGEQALALFREHQAEVRLVILDLSLPGMGGDEILHELHLIDPEIRVVLSSGYSEADVIQRIHGEKIAGFIQKPYRAHTLVERVREHLYDG